MEANEMVHRLNQLLKGQRVESVLIPRPYEVVIQFEGGMRFFAHTVDKTDLDLSITGGSEGEHEPGA